MRQFVDPPLSGRARHVHGEVFSTKRDRLTDEPSGKDTLGARLFQMPRQLKSRRGREQTLRAENHNFPSGHPRQVRR
jgi:hypothetical protein